MAHARYSFFFLAHCFFFRNRGGGVVKNGFFRRTRNKKSISFLASHPFVIIVVNECVWSDGTTCTHKHLFGVNACGTARITIFASFLLLSMAVIIECSR